MEVNFFKKNALFLVLCGAFLLRFLFLASVPPSPSLDEVSLGYNAYSLLLTGRDEFGYSFPVLLRAYDDWRPALYVYLIIPFVKILGLDLLAVRLPSALLSVITILATFYLTKEFVVNPVKEDKKKTKLFFIPIITTVLITISPWHIYISRLGHEVNPAHTFLVLGILFFVRFYNLQQTRKIIFSLLLSSVFFALSFSSYQSTKIVVPLLVMVLGVLFIKKLWRHKLTALFSVLLGFIILIPTLLELTKPYGLVRFQGTNIFSARPEILEKSAYEVARAKERGDFIGEVVFNRRIQYGLLFVNAYTSHLNPFWLSTNTGDEPFKISNFGLLYWFEIPFLILGIYFTFIKNVIPKKFMFFLFVWFFISILPGALTTGYPHAMRVYNILPVPYIFISIGVLGIISYTKWKNHALFVVSIIYSVAFIGFFYSYLFIFPTSLSHHFQYGLLDSLTFADQNKSQYDHIIVSTKDSLFQSYMFYLYLTKYNPHTYQNNGGTKSGGFASEHKIDSFYFTPDPFKITTSGKVLYLLPPGTIPSHARELKIFKTLSGKNSVVAWEKEKSL